MQIISSERTPFCISSQNTNKKQKNIGAESYKHFFAIERKPVFAIFENNYV